VLKGPVPTKLVVAFANLGRSRYSAEVGLMTVTEQGGGGLIVVASGKGPVPVKE
jgi:hypothetical protein